MWGKMGGPQTLVDKRVNTHPCREISRGNVSVMELSFNAYWYAGLGAEGWKKVGVLYGG